MKFVIFLLLIIGLTACGFIDGDCDDECTSPEYTTPYYTNPSQKERKLLGVKFDQVRLQIIKSDLLDFLNRWEFKDAIIADQVNVGVGSGFISIFTNIESNEVSSLNYKFKGCDNISDEDMQVIKLLISIVTQEPIDLFKLLKFSFNQDYDIDSNIIQIKNGLIFEASCDPSNQYVYFHIYRD